LVGAPQNGSKGNLPTAGKLPNELSPDFRLNGCRDCDENHSDKLHAATLRALQFASAVATSDLGHPRTWDILSLKSISHSNGTMSDELDTIQAEVTNGQSSQIAMDEAFCLRMRAAIEAGLESAPIGVVTTPGTKNPRHVPTEPRPLVSSQRDVEHA
jgi:hypothetical protein